MMTTLQIPMMDAIQDYTNNMVRILSDKYNFDYKDAIHYIQTYKEPSIKRITDVSDSESSDNEKETESSDESETSVELNSDSISESNSELQSELPDKPEIVNVQDKTPQPTQPITTKHNQIHPNIVCYVMLCYAVP